MIANKYDLVEKIGSGAFGSIYKGRNVRTNEPVAIKVEPLKHETNLLKNEARIYQYLKGGSGIPQVKWFGVDDANNYMVINLLGESLQSHIDTYGPFSLLSATSIGAQMVERIEYVHGCGLIHRDIKPDNFLFGLNDQREKLYLIDFGFCKKCDSSRAPPKKMTSVLGTPKYVSISVHNLNEPNKHDDIESILYTILYLYYGKLPWDTPKIANDEIKLLKEDLFGDNVSASVPNVFRKMATIIAICRESSVDPDYKTLITLLHNR